MVRKIAKIVVIVLALLFLIAQFIRPEFTNPPVAEAETMNAAAQVPSGVQQILARSCNDCHSNQTRYPWYSYVTPFNWFLAGHIDDARRELNFSEWGSYKADRKVRKLNEICEEVQSGAMPLPSYLWIHRSAALSEGDIKLLCEWSSSEASRVPQ